ncbi:MAG: carbohydrate ABC transporter permease [Clostridiales bacterium]|jgi:raffinose/stachyose/melibiose transport system permease protein/N-acetylglucosamine transport system permease protein|nr:carbohydrate ABC transporter permease [Clostridiales bacterium]
MKRAGNKIKRKREQAILWVFFAVFFLYSLTLVFPFLWLFYNSLKSKQEFLMSGSPMALPREWLFSNYIDVFRMENFNLPEMFFNSFTLVIGQVLAGLFVCACTAYVVSKYNFKGRNAIYFVAIIIMFIPTTGSLAVFYKFMFDTNLQDNYAGMLITAAGGFGFNFLLLYGFFKNISWSYAEAAFIDGAGNFRVFFTIMLPQARAALFALGILGAIGVWNDFMSQFLFYPSHVTVAVGIKSLSDNIVSYGADYPRFFAATILTTLPVVVVYAAFQKTIIKNTMAGGLKG